MYKHTLLYKSLNGALYKRGLFYKDVETGLYYLNSRYYNPEIGRFINADGQLNEGILGKNMYAYTENNPVMFVDPDGNDYQIVIPILYQIAGWVSLIPVVGPAISTICVVVATGLSLYNLYNEAKDLYEDISDDGISDGVATPPNPKLPNNNDEDEDDENVYYRGVTILHLKQVNINIIQLKVKVLRLILIQIIHMW